MWAEDEEWRLREDFLHRMMLLHACEAEIQPAVFEREPAVVETQEVQNRGLHIVDVHWVLHHLESELIRLANGDARANTAAGEPHGEGLRMMVAP